MLVAGPNTGRIFWVCQNVDENKVAQCKYFAWDDEQESTGAQRNSGQQRGGAGGRGGGRADDGGGGSGSGECFICHERELIMTLNAEPSLMDCIPEGHWSSACPSKDTQGGGGRGGARGDDGGGGSGSGECFICHERKCILTDNAKETLLIGLHCRGTLVECLSIQRYSRRWKQRSSTRRR